VPGVAQMLIDHSGSVGTSLTWEHQLLASAAEAQKVKAA